MSKSRRPWSSDWRLTKLGLPKLGLLGMVMVLTVAAAYTSLLIVRRQQALSEVSRYNIAWSLSQAALEVSRLQGAVAAALIPGSEVDEDSVQLWLDIVANRVQLFRGGDVAEFVAISPELCSIVSNFREAAQAGQAIMEEPATPDRLRRLLLLFSPLNAPMARLAAAANTNGGRLVAQDQEQLSSLHWLFASILGGLTLSAFGLIGALTRRNRLLAQAWEQVEQQNKVLEKRDRELLSQNARISFMAHHDALTGLPNRLLFHDRLEEALEHWRQRRDGVALLCLDLDRFKQVNDTLGHPAGDMLLRVVAERLRECVREGDVVARLGGDEFAVLLCGANHREHAKELAQRIVKALGAAYDLDGHRAIVGASVGIAIATADLDSADVLLMSADMALYQAKTNGRGSFFFFESAMNEQVQARRAIELDLREALGRGEFEVHYQPVIGLQDQRTSGFEALIRWRHPRRGMISPAEFIPLAEELGLIVSIGEWVTAQACADAVKWPDHVKVAVNLSPVQFRSPGLVASVRRALERSGLPAHRLELEITESALLQDSEAVLASLHELRALGLRTALDDFGTGYSSLSYLRSFPFDKLKIDQSFVREMTQRADCLTIVTSVLGLARELGMATTAEGVETEEQLRHLREAGCTEVQGFLFDRPRPVADIARWFVPGSDWVRVA
ncbi:putative bifunctional diguanylate cyclase/phosphodiesterase [Roseomonas sp. GCM10028921]